MKTAITVERIADSVLPQGKRYVNIHSADSMKPRIVEAFKRNVKDCSKVTELKWSKSYQAYVARCLGKPAGSRVHGRGFVTLGVYTLTMSKDDEPVAKEGEAADELRAEVPTIATGVKDWRSMLTLGCSADRDELVMVAARNLRALGETPAQLTNVELAVIVESLAVTMGFKRQADAALRDRLESIGDAARALVELVEREDA